MSAMKMVRVWDVGSGADTALFADEVGGDLEKDCEVTSSAGNLWRMDGVDIRAVMGGLKSSCNHLKGKNHDAD